MNTIEAKGAKTIEAKTREVKTRGIVLGKFYPPHMGHQYLIAFANAYVGELTVIVEQMPNEKIPASLRCEWLMSIFENVNFIVLKDFNPQDPNETSDFWNIWQRSLQKLLQHPVDFVFASEGYGVPLASCLGAEFIPVDPLRERFPISGTEVRGNPYQYWRFLTEPVKQHFRKRVCICGPESTGKTTLSQWLVTTLNNDASYTANLIPEFARTYLENRAQSICQTDVLNIAHGQKTSEDLVFDDIAPLQIIDTGVLASQVWSEFLFGDCDVRLSKLCDQTEYDLYLLCSPDVPWVEDDVRFLPDRSDEFYQRLKYLLQKKANTKVVRIIGTWEERNQRSLTECKALLGI